MAYEAAGAADFRQRLLTAPGERRDVDYKSSMPFASNDQFSLNLIRHIQGMANADGGWIVIGLTQTDENKFIPDPHHSEDVCGSYEPTQLAQRVNSRLARGQQIDLTVYFELHPETELRYPVIRVQGFERTPHICRSDVDATDTRERVLRQGAVYIRRPSAETSEVSTASDWEELIARCVQRRRDDFLAEFRDLFDRMTSTGAPLPPPNQALLEWTEQGRRAAFEAP